MELGFHTPLRVFSPDEAGRLVPSLQLSFAAIHQIRAEVEQLLGKLARRDPGGVSAILSGQKAPPADLEPDVLRLQGRLLDLGQAIESILGMGVLLHDVDQGIVDFASELEGRHVLLCWQVGEPSVEWFHEVGASTDARRPLPHAHPLVQ